MEEWGVRRVASLGVELKRWRTRRKLSLRALADRVHCDHSQLWKIEAAKTVLSKDMAIACDQALDTGGALVAAWTAAQGSVRPAQLPAAPARIAGRETELAALRAGTQDRPRGAPSVVAIDGPAGVGKTTLALRWAHQIASEYVDGQLYADLGGFAPPGQQVPAAVVLESFLAAMGASAIPDTAGERAALYRSLLAGRKVLVVLDNVADVNDIEQLLPASAGCALVVTSRRTLSGLVARIGATRMTVRPLDETASITVICDVIGTRRADAELDAIATVVRLCGHLPVALRAAAEQIAMYPHRAVADLVDELIEEEHRLSALEMNDLRNVFSWSYNGVGQDAARLFRLIGLHRGPHLSVAAATAMAGLSQPQARRLLHRLASVHLVEIDSNDMIRLQELVRAYARELVALNEDDDQPDAAIQRLTRWYAGAARAVKAQLAHHPLEPASWLSVNVDVAAVIFTNDVTARAWWNDEWDNFGPVTMLALEHGPRAVAHELVAELADIDTLEGWPAADEPPGAQPCWPSGARGQLPVPDEDDYGDCPRTVAANNVVAAEMRRTVGSTADRSMHRSEEVPEREPVLSGSLPQTASSPDGAMEPGHDHPLWTDSEAMWPSVDEGAVPASRSEVEPQRQFTGTLPVDRLT